MHKMLEAYVEKDGVKEYITVDDGYRYTGTVTLMGCIKMTDADIAEIAGLQIQF